MKIFLDTNIVLDYIIDGRPCQKEAHIIMEQAARHAYDVVVSTQSIIDCAYIAAKNGADMNDVRSFFDWLSTHINMEGIDVFDIRKALNVEIDDFEDMAQFLHAEDNDCDVFVTRDRKLQDWKSETGMKVMSSVEFVARMQ